MHLLNGICFINMALQCIIYTYFNPKIQTQLTILLTYFGSVDLRQKDVLQCIEHAEHIHDQAALWDGFKDLIKTRSPLGMRGRVAGEHRIAMGRFSSWAAELVLLYECPLLGITE